MVHNPNRLLLLVVTCVVAASAPARAEPVHDDSYTTSIFTYGFRGFLLGAGTGLGGGYLFARAGGWQSDDWRPLTLGVGIGALAGGTLGVGLGVADMMKATPGRGSYVLRDGAWGLGFGAVTGGIVGGLAAVESREAEHILLGAAIGALAGTTAGVIMGVVEGQRVTSRAGRTTVSIAPVQTPGRSTLWGPAFVGVF